MPPRLECGCGGSRSTLTFLALCAGRLKLLQVCSKTLYFKDQLRHVILHCDLVAPNLKYPLNERSVSSRC